MKRILIMENDKPAAIAANVPAALQHLKEKYGLEPNELIDLAAGKMAYVYYHGDLEITLQKIPAVETPVDALAEGEDSIELEVPLDTLVDLGGMDGLNELVDEAYGGVTTDIRYQVLGATPEGLVRIRATFEPFEDAQSTPNVTREFSSQAEADAFMEGLNFASDESVFTLGCRPVNEGVQVLIHDERA